MIAAGVESGLSVGGVWHFVAVVALSGAEAWDFVEVDSTVVNVNG